jgi:hypothetical protein
MIRALRRVAEKIGRTPMASNSAPRKKTQKLCYSDHKRKSEPCSAAIIYTFGSWNAALEAAGLPLNNLQPKWEGFGAKTFTDDELIEAVRDMAAQYPVLTTQLYHENRPKGSPSLSLIRRRLRKSIGTWQQIVAYVGGQSGPGHRRLKKATAT